jgi:oligopeptide transport system substrate-binding protein
MPSPLLWRLLAGVCCGGIVWMLLAAGCTDTSSKDDSNKAPIVVSAQVGGDYRKPLENEPPTLDPVQVTSTYAVSVVQQLFDGLVQFDADLNVIPALAKSWSASRDGLTWTFHLRPGVRFHHGREVTAEDVVYSFTRLLDPAVDSPRSWLFERVQGARAFQAGQAERVEGLQVLDPYTLHITLSQPYAPFITMLGMAQAKIVPREEVARLGAHFGRAPVGTGPFRFGSWESGQQIILAANETYFEGRPFLDHLHYRIFPAGDHQAIFAAFATGQLEEAPIPAPERQRLQNEQRYHFLRKPLLATLFLWLNTHEAPLNNVKVRQAINYAINRPAINTTIRQDRFVQAQGILPAGMPGYNPELESYDYNEARARQLLAEAGYPEGQGLPTLELWSSVASPTARAEHEAIQRDLQKIGIPVVLHTSENWQQFTELLGQRPRAMYRYAWFADFPDPDNYLFSLFYSQSANNFANYNNPQVDSLLHQAQRETDGLKRVQLYRRAETLITADAPTVNLVYYTFERLFQPYVQGIEVNALGERHIPMKKIWLDRAHHAFPKTVQTH